MKKNINKPQDINERVFNLLESTGLNWEVSKEPLISSNDHAKTDSFGLFKKTDRIHLGTVGNRYQPFQNAKLAESIILASDSIDLAITRGGELNGGKKVYLQAQLPEEYIGKSKVKRYLTALNSHDGSTSIGFGSSNTVVVCQNTFYHAYGELNKVRHGVSAEERIEAMARDMNAALINDQKLMETFKKMANEPLKDSLVERVIRKIFEVEPGTSQTEISTRKKNILTDFAGALETEIGLEGSTVWALFNGVTRYTNHIAAPENATKKIDYLMTGRGYQLSNMTFDLLSEELGIGEYELVSK